MKLGNNLRTYSIDSLVKPLHNQSSQESVISDPSSKEELIEAMISARGRFDSLVNQIPHSKMTLSGASGEWSVKDVVAHITSYDRWMGLTLALHGQKPLDFWIEDIPLDEFNRRLFDENRNLPLDQVLQQSGMSGARSSQQPAPCQSLTCSLSSPFEAIHTHSSPAKS